MRELPLNDKEWVMNHIGFYYSDWLNTRINLYLNDLMLIKDISELSEYQIVSQREKKILVENTKGKLLVFRDTVTSELFKFALKGEDLTQVLANALYYHNKIPQGVMANYRITMRSMYLFTNDGQSPKGKFIDNFINSNYDTKLLSDSSSSLFRDYVSQKLNKTKIIYNVENSLKDQIINKIKSDNEPVYQSEFASFVLGLYNRSNAREILGANTDAINIKFMLLKTKYFTGKYKAYMDKYTDTRKNNKVFDTITIQFNMISDYDNNLAYLKSNNKEVKSILKYVIETNKLSKEYANYLKLYSLILTRDNILVARFCLKDGLENLKLT